MLTVRDLYSRIWNETNIICEKTGRSYVPFFIYLDSASLRELKIDVEKQETLSQFGQIFVEEDGSMTFAGNKVFVVLNATFHCNVVPML